MDGSVDCFVFFAKKGRGLEQYFGYFSGAIVVIVLAASFSAARRNAQRKPPSGDRMNFVVRAPGVVRGLGIGCAACFGLVLALCSFLAAYDPNYPFYASVFGVLCTIGIILLFYSIRWKLAVNGDKLVLTPLFGKDKVFYVRNVTHIKVDGSRGVRAYADQKRLFSALSISPGISLLISYFIENGVRAPEKINLSHPDQRF
ncbi:MAG: hypothetical protein LBS91_10305 [Clostridiales Family XIII bacterium]|nr:hypothetical protein [Clostridiales Family XIII bacterium]